MEHRHPKCKICNTREASCKAHIIPKQFYRRIRKNAPHLYGLEVSAQKIDRKFTQSGIWEQGLFCYQCDRQMGIYDDYAYKVLPAEPKLVSFQQFGLGYEAYNLGNIDVVRLKLFLVALMFRCHQAEHLMFEQVKLGPFKEKFLRCLREANSTVLEHVNCVVALLKPPNPKIDKIIFPPYRTRFEGVNVVQVYLYPWKLIVKVDQRPFGSSMKPFELKEDEEAMAIVQDDWTMGEKRILRDLKGKVARL